MKGEMTKFSTFDATPWKDLEKEMDQDKIS